MAERVLGDPLKMAPAVEEDMESSQSSTMVMDDQGATNHNP